MRWLVALCALMRIATADPSTQAKAEALFEKGQADYRSGQYAAAIELFKQAYEVERDPVYLFNIAQGYRKSLDCLNAYDYYRRYLDASPTAENKAKVQQWLRDLQPCADDRRKEHDAALRAQELERQQHDGEAAKSPTAVAPPPPRAATTTVNRGTGLRIAGLATAAAGGLGLIVGIAYGIQGANLKNEIGTKCNGGTCNWNDPVIAALNSDGHRANTLAYVGYIGGGLAVLAGTGLYLYGRSRVETVTIGPGPTVGVAFRY